jgi:adhesin transport system membrane fusion protein
VSHSGWIKALGRYFGGSGAVAGEPLPEVRKALLDDGPRIVRLTIWALIGFVAFFLLWAGFAQVEEVTRGEGKAIPTSRLQKIQNLEGGIVTEI